MIQSHQNTQSSNLNESKISLDFDPPFNFGYYQGRNDDHPPASFIKPFKTPSQTEFKTCSVSYKSKPSDRSEVYYKQDLSPMKGADLNTISKF